MENSKSIKTCIPKLSCCSFVIQDLPYGAFRLQISTVTERTQGNFTSSLLVDILPVTLPSMNALNLSLIIILSVGSVCAVIAFLLYKRNQRLKSLSYCTEGQPMIELE
jgi:hypothetical protein